MILDGTENNQALKEAQALASLSALDDNPFVVRYYNAWIEDDKLYLAVEKSLINDIKPFLDGTLSKQPSKVERRTHPIQ